MAKYLVLPGRRWEITDTLRRPTLNRLRELRKVSGLGMQSIVEGLTRRDAIVEAQINRVRAQIEAGQPVEDLDVAVSSALSEEPKVLDAMCAFVWLARREAGESISLDDVDDFNPADFKVLTDDDQAEQVPVDPTTPATDSVPAAGSAQVASPS